MKKYTCSIDNLHGEQVFTADDDIYALCIEAGMSFIRNSQIHRNDTEGPTMTVVCNDDGRILHTGKVTMPVP